MPRPKRTIVQRRAALWALLAFALWGISAPRGQAQVRPAAHSLYSSRLRHVVETIPFSPTDLPPSLARHQDIYLLVTAGAAYTEIQAVADPDLPPETLARALSLSLAPTSLRRQAVEWSTGTYSVAQVSAHAGHIGSRQASNTIPFAALVQGLRRAGLAPHLLLRVAGHARAAGLPGSHYGSRAFRWYDATGLGRRAAVTLTARLAWVSLAQLATYALLPLLICLTGLALAPVLSRWGRKDTPAQRQAYRSVGSIGVMAVFFAQFGGMVYLLQTPAPATVADLWLGSSTTTALVPLLVAGIVALPLFMILMRKRETQLFGALPPLPAIPMSDEEQAVRKRVAQAQAVPHLLGAVGLIGLPFLVPRSSPLYSALHPLSAVLSVAGAGIIARVFQKRLDRFTQKTADETLTWRARQLGQALAGVRMPDVQVEDSSRAAHLAFASHQGHVVTLSRKLQATFTSAETDFVLAYHLACMSRGRSSGSQWLGLLLPLPMLVLSAVVLMPHWFHGVFPLMTHLFISTWLFPVLLGYGGLMFLILLWVVKSSATQQAKRDVEADQAALAVTGDLTAAQSALDKLIADTGRLPAQTGSAAASGSVVTLQADQALRRRAALLRSPQGPTPAAGTSPRGAALQKAGRWNGYGEARPQQSESAAPERQD